MITALEKILHLSATIVVSKVLWMTQTYSQDGRGTEVVFLVAFRLKLVGFHFCFFLIISYVPLGVLIVTKYEILAVIGDNSDNTSRTWFLLRTAMLISNMALKFV